MPGKPQGPAIVRDCPHGGRHQHGTPAAYKDDECRCDACRAACAADWRERSRLKAYGRFQPAWVSPVGAMRRLCALSAIGWCASQLGDESGLFRTHVQAIRAGRKGYLSVETDRVVRDLYDRLWDQAPPQRNRHEKASYTRAVRYARAAGWVPPLAWDDDEIDDPAAAPQNPANIGWERKPCGTVAAARRHYRRGEPLDEACRRADSRAVADRRAAA